MVGCFSQGCCNQNQFVSDELAAFTLKVVFQDPSNGFEEVEGKTGETRPLELSDIDRLTETCVARLINDSGPIMETIRMQVKISRIIA